MVISFCLLTMPTLYSFPGKFRLSYFYASDNPKRTRQHKKIYINTLKTNRYPGHNHIFSLCKKSQHTKTAAPVDFPRVFVFFCIKENFYHRKKYHPQKNHIFDIKKYPSPNRFYQNHLRFYAPNRKIITKITGAKNAKYRQHNCERKNRCTQT